MLSPVEILSFETLTIPVGKLQHCDFDSPAIYAVLSGKFLLQGTQAAASGPGAGSNGDGTVDSSPADHASALGAGGVLLLTRSFPESLESLRDVGESADQPGRCLKIRFQFAESDAKHIPSLPVSIRGFNLIELETSPLQPRGDSRFSLQDLPEGEQGIFQTVTNLLIGALLATVPAVRNRLLRPRFEPAVSEALLAMERDPAKPWTIESLAAAVGVSRSSLSQKFKSQIGRTLNDHLLEVRMQLAENYLTQQRHQLKEIARLTGYLSVSAFSTAYKRWSGESPSVRRKIRSEQ